MENGKFSVHVSRSVKFLLEPSLCLKCLLEGKAAAAGGGLFFSSLKWERCCGGQQSLFERCGTPRELNRVPRGVTVALRTHVYLCAVG